MQLLRLQALQVQPGRTNLEIAHTRGKCPWHGCVELTAVRPFALAQGTKEIGFGPTRQERGRDARRAGCTVLTIQCGTVTAGATADMCDVITVFRRTRRDVRWRRWLRVIDEVCGYQRKRAHDEQCT